MSRPILQLDDVVVAFGDRVALDGVSIAAAPGAVTAVVGGDGAGKTTLLRAVVGLVPLASGSLVVPEPASIGYLPASLGSWSGLTVQENVDFVAGSYAMPTALLAARADELLTVAGLAAFRHRLARQLSGGMRRKLGVVLALLHDPELLVLDEPSTGLDPVSRVGLWRLAARTAARGRTVLMTTTYLEEAQRAAEVVVLDQGRVLVSGPPAAILDSMPGVLTSADRAVRPDWAWRRGRAVHEVWIDEPPPERLPRIAPDLEDVVTARSLQRLAAGRGTS